MGDVEAADPVSYIFLFEFFFLNIRINYFILIFLIYYCCFQINNITRRGKRIFDAIVEDLITKGMANAENVRTATFLKYFFSSIRKFIK